MISGSVHPPWPPCDDFFEFLSQTLKRLIFPMNRGLFVSLDKFALRKNMMPTHPRDYFFRREESRSSLRALLESPSFIYATFRAEKPERIAKSASSSESWASWWA